MDVRKILCPVDFSDPSRKAMEAAAMLARRFGASITLLHVYHMPTYFYPTGIGLPPPEIREEIDRGIHASLAAWKGDLAKVDVTRVETQMLEGLPWKGIVDRAEQGGFDMVVMGTHGHTGLKQVVLGSVAERVVRHAGCPVLTIPPIGPARV